MTNNYQKKKNGKNATGRPLKFSSPEEMEKQGMEYIEDCKKNDKPITITGLCIRLDTTRQTLMDYERKCEFADTIKRLKLHAENYAEETLYNKNGRAVVGAIFALKNFGWSDKMEFESSYKPQIMTDEERQAIRARVRRFSE
jgi:hypothetical protein